MPLKLEDALNAYGFVGTLAGAIPDLKAILNKAIKGEWVPERFTREVMDSGWWKSNAESVRQLVRLRTTDPATYKQNLANAEHKVGLMAGQMGREVNAKGLALQALLNNWDDQQLAANIGAWGRLDRSQGPALVGDAAKTDSFMREMATNYGVSFTDTGLRAWITRVQSGKDTLDGFEALVRSRAKAQFPHLANQIDSGMTVRDVADPYIATYAQTLELPETGIKLTDPRIQKALQAKDPKSGAFSNKPMHEFVRELKDDPRWDKTANAREEAYAMVNKLGRDFGFLS